MKHTTHFNSFLNQTVNLSKWRLEKLEDRVGAIYTALKNDETLGPRVVKKIPQGSWAQRTIINPVGSAAFDADFMLLMEEEPDWANDPKQYANAVYNALHNHRTYKDMPHGRKCRCVYVNYAENAMHVDVVPYVVLSDGRKVIINRDANTFESTDPEGFTQWMRDKDAITNGNLRKTIRLVKYIRDHKGSFGGVRSILITTLLGERVEAWRNAADPGYYADLPTTLLHVMRDLDDYLQGSILKPTVYDPSNTGGTFDHRWTQETYANFRTRIHAITLGIEAAFDETDSEKSVAKWQKVFGAKFKVPDASKASSKFGAEAGAAAAAVSTVRSGRAG